MQLKHDVRLQLEEMQESNNLNMRKLENLIKKQEEQNEDSRGLQKAAVENSQRSIQSIQGLSDKLEEMNKLIFMLAIFFKFSLFDSQCFQRFL